MARVLPCAVLLPLALCACADLNHLSGGKTCGTRRGVDLRTDAQNCGACGHDCLGGACIDGACQPAVLASGLQQPTAIAVDGCANMVFWTNQTKVNPQGGTVMSCSTDVGTCAQTPTTIAVAEQQPFAIAIDADYVYFSTIAGFGTVRQCRRDVGCTGTGRSSGAARPCRRAARRRSCSRSSATGHTSTGRPTAAGSSSDARA